MDIVFATDSGYLTPTRVAVRSLLGRADPGGAIRIFVADGGLDGRDEDVLRADVEAAGAHIEILRPTDGTVHQMATGGHVSAATYLRLLVPDLVPDDVERLLYLDGDILVNEPLDELWNADLGGRALAAVRDFEVPEFGGPGGVPDCDGRGLDPHTPFVNAGVLVIDVRRWRELRVGDATFEELIRHESLSNDQGALNAVAADEITLLDPRWNAQGSILHADQFAPSPYKDALLRRRAELLHDAAIVHFVGHHKPWHDTCAHPAAVRWRLVRDRLADVDERHTASFPSPGARSGRAANPTGSPPAVSVIVPHPGAAVDTDTAGASAELIVPAVGAGAVDAPGVLAFPEDPGAAWVWRSCFEAARGPLVAFALTDAVPVAEIAATATEMFGRFPEVGVLIAAAGPRTPLDPLEASTFVRDECRPFPDWPWLAFRREVLIPDDFDQDGRAWCLDVHLVLAAAPRTRTLIVATDGQESARAWRAHRFREVAGSEKLAEQLLRLDTRLAVLAQRRAGETDEREIAVLRDEQQALVRLCARLVPPLGTTPGQRRARLGGPLRREVPPGAVVAFADDDMWGPQTIGGIEVRPFPSRGGVFAGHPADGGTLVDALAEERPPIDHLGFAGTNRWWLSHYGELATELARRWDRVIDTPELLLFRRRREART